VDIFYDLDSLRIAQGERERITRLIWAQDLSQLLIAFHLDPVQGNDLIAEGQAQLVSQAPGRVG